MADCGPVEDMKGKKVGGSLEFDGSNAQDPRFRDSRRIAAHAEDHLPSVSIVNRTEGSIERRLDDGMVKTRSAIILLVKIGEGDAEEWYEIAYPSDGGKSEILTPDELKLSQIGEHLRVPGRRAEIIGLIKSNGTKQD